MITPIKRIQYGAVSLGCIFVLSVLAFRLIAGYSWMESLWMVVVTFSTVGYSERSELDADIQLLMVAVIMFGVTAAFYTFGGFLQMLMQGEIESAFGQRRRSREISRMKNHVIVCGFGRLGQDLVAQLNYRNIDCVVIEIDKERISSFEGTLPPIEIGDAFSEATLAKTGIAHARAIVAGLPTDADNIFITLTARNLRPDILIIAKCERYQSCSKFKQAGANRIVMPHQVGAQQMERMISRPSAADLFELIAEVGETDLELDEIFVDGNAALLNKSVVDSGIENDFQIIVVGVKNREGQFQFNPRHRHALDAGDTLLILGGSQQIEKFKKSLGR